MSQIRIFCDGACSGNPGPGGWASIIEYQERETLFVKELGGHDPATTNNRMEILAVSEALEWSTEHCKFDAVEILTDSKYTIDGATKWISGWVQRGWRTSTGEAVKNQDLWQRLQKQLHDLKTASGLRLSPKFTYLKGHAGIPGNERCDQLAVALSKGEPLHLFDGRAADYTVDLSAVSVETPYYLSLVEGKVFRDKSWAACEARVRSKKGARYKKCTAREEPQILLGWGFRGD